MTHHSETAPADESGLWTIRRYRRLATAAGRMPPPAPPPATFGGRLPDARGPARSATTRGLARLPTLPSLRQHTREGTRPGNRSIGSPHPQRKKKDKKDLAQDCCSRSRLLQILPRCARQAVGGPLARSYDEHRYNLVGAWLNASRNRRRRGRM